MKLNSAPSDYFCTCFRCQEQTFFLFERSRAIYKTVKRENIWLTMSDAWERRIELKTKDSSVHTCQISVLNYTVFFEEIFEMSKY